MFSHDEFVAKLLSDPEVKAEYDAMEDGLALFDDFLKTGRHAGLTQAGLSAWVRNRPPWRGSRQAGGTRNIPPPSLRYVGTLRP